MRSDRKRGKRPRSRGSTSEVRCSTVCLGLLAVAALAYCALVLVTSPSDAPPPPAGDQTAWASKPQQGHRPAPERALGLRQQGGEASSRPAEARARLEELRSEVEAKTREMASLMLFLSGRPPSPAASQGLAQGLLDSVPVRAPALAPGLTAKPALSPAGGGAFPWVTGASGGGGASASAQLAAAAASQARQNSQRVGPETSPRPAGAGAGPRAGAGAAPRAEGRNPILHMSEQELRETPLDELLGLYGPQGPAAWARVAPRLAGGWKPSSAGGSSSGGGGGRRSLLRRPGRGGGGAASATGCDADFGVSLAKRWRGTARECCSPPVRQKLAGAANASRLTCHLVQQTAHAGQGDQLL